MPPPPLRALRLLIGDTAYAQRRDPALPAQCAAGCQIDGPAGRAHRLPTKSRPRLDGQTHDTLSFTGPPFACNAPARHLTVRRVRRYTVPQPRQPAIPDGGSGSPVALLMAPDPVNWLLLSTKPEDRIDSGTARIGLRRRRRRCWPGTANCQWSKSTLPWRGFYSPCWRRSRKHRRLLAVPRTRSVETLNGPPTLCLAAFERPASLDLWYATLARPVSLRSLVQAHPPTSDRTIRCCLNLAGAEILRRSPQKALRWAREQPTSWCWIETLGASEL